MVAGRRLHGDGPPRPKQFTFTSPPSAGGCLPAVAVAPAVARAAKLPERRTSCQGKNRRR